MKNIRLCAVVDPRAVKFPKVTYVFDADVEDTLGKP